jgi:hypothetical protein
MEDVAMALASGSNPTCGALPNSSLIGPPEQTKMNEQARKEANKNVQRVLDP